MPRDVRGSVLLFCVTQSESPLSLSPLALAVRLYHRTTSGPLYRVDRHEEGFALITTSQQIQAKVIVSSPSSSLRGKRNKTSSLLLSFALLDSDFAFVLRLIPLSEVKRQNCALPVPSFFYLSHSPSSSSPAVTDCRNDRTRQAKARGENEERKSLFLSPYRQLLNCCGCCFYITQALLSPAATGSGPSLNHQVTTSSTGFLIARHCATGSSRKS